MVRDRDRWTPDQVLHHLTALLEADRRATDQRFEDTRVAVNTARQASDRRLDVMNEFRAQLNDQTSTFLTRAESDQRHQTTLAVIDGLIARIAALEQSERDRNSAERGGNAVWGYVVGAAGFVLAVAGFAAGFLP